MKESLSSPFSKEGNGMPEESLSGATLKFDVTLGISPTLIYSLTDDDENNHPLS